MDLRVYLFSLILVEYLFYQPSIVLSLYDNALYFVCKLLIFSSFVGANLIMFCVIIYYCDIEGTIPTELGGLGSLSFLSMHNNMLSGIYALI